MSCSTSQRRLRWVTAPTLLLNSSFVTIPREPRRDTERPSYILEPAATRSSVILTGVTIGRIRRYLRVNQSWGKPRIRLEPLSRESRDNRHMWSLPRRDRPDVSVLCARLSLLRPSARSFGRSPWLCFNAWRVKPEAMPSRGAPGIHWSAPPGPPSLGFWCWSNGHCPLVKRQMNEAKGSMKKIGVAVSLSDRTA